MSPMNQNNMLDISCNVLPESILARGIEEFLCDELVNYFEPLSEADVET